MPPGLLAFLGDPDPDPVQSAAGLNGRFVVLASFLDVALVPFGTPTLAAV